MEQDAFLESIGRNAGAIRDALGRDPDAAIASCPGWRTRDLVVHLGVIHRWAEEMVRNSATERLRNRERFAIDRESPGLGDWIVEGASRLVRTLADTPSQQPVWSWIPDSTALFWTRRQAHETAVHRWDADAAVGNLEPLDAALAADGIDEVLNVFGVGRSRAESKIPGNGESFHFHCTDVAGEWMVRFDGGGMEVRPEHAKGDVAVRGPASELLLCLWGRRPWEGLEVIGNAGLLERWFALVPPT